MLFSRVADKLELLWPCAGANSFCQVLERASLAWAGQPCACRVELQAANAAATAPSVAAPDAPRARAPPAASCTLTARAERGLRPLDIFRQMASVCPQGVLMPLVCACKTCCERTVCLLWCAYRYETHTLCVSCVRSWSCTVRGGGTLAKLCVPSCQLRPGGRSRRPHQSRHISSRFFATCSRSRSQSGRTSARKITARHRVIRSPV